jgi:hypothetical protein
VPCTRLLRPTAQPSGPAEHDAWAQPGTTGPLWTRSPLEPNRSTPRHGRRDGSRGAIVRDAIDDDPSQCVLPPPPECAGVMCVDRSRPSCSAHSSCVMCDRDPVWNEAEVYFENEHVVYASSPDPATAPDVLPGSGIAVPIAHSASPFDFTAEDGADGEQRRKQPATTTHTLHWRMEKEAPSGSLRTATRPTLNRSKGSTEIVAPNSAARAAVRSVSVTAK